MSGLLQRRKPAVAQLRKEIARLAKLTHDQRTRLQQVEETVARVDKRTRKTKAETGARASVGALARAGAFDGLDIPYPERLRLHRFRLLSQNEEDGITLELLRHAGFGPQRFVEIGCGTNGGNSGFLVDELGWHGLMVDAEEANVQIMRRRFNAELLQAEQAWITAESVGELVGNAGFAGEIGFLSIDIDGNDFWVWKALDAVDPRVVCVEYNSAWGPERAVVVPYDPEFRRKAVAEARGHYYGASLAALAALAGEKGYRLVTTDQRGVNAFFLRNDLAPEIPACTAPRAYRLLDTYRRDLEQGWDLWSFVQERRLPVVDVAP